MTKKNNFTISCIIATHNRDALLKKTIDSILKQTILPDEIIVVDNCTSNKTKIIVEELSKKKINLKYLSHNYGGKGSSSRNIGSLYSKSDYLAMIDDDDLWKENYIEEVLNFLKFNPNTKILYTWFDYILENEKIVEGKKIIENLKSKNFLIKNPGSIISNLVIEKKLFFTLGGFNEAIHPSYDRDLIIKAINRGFKYRVLQKKLILMRNQKQVRDSSVNLDNIIGQLKFIRSNVSIFNMYIYINFILKTIYQLFLKYFKNV